MNPRESAEFITKHSDHVFIDEDGIKKTAAKIHETCQDCVVDLQSQGSVAKTQPCVEDKNAVNWLFFIHALNFSFWTEPGKQKYEISLHGKKFSGSLAFFAAVKKAVLSGKPLVDPTFYSRVTYNEMRVLLKSDSNAMLPLLEERTAVANRVGQVLLDKWNGDFENCVNSCKNSATELLRVIVDDFADFRDDAVFKGQKVTFYKRAQVLISDIDKLYKKKGIVSFQDMDSLTAFADYRIPQLLVHMGALKYDKELLEKIQDGHMFKNGDPEEVEIRGATIKACEGLVAELKNLQCSLNAAQVDWFLWNHAQTVRAKTKLRVQFHRVRCKYY